ncbi:MAG: hypothetical protein K8S99_17510 [Planctomycetes bacterium]|nr:hypothetical protein [Planctomycetota bacterium]
MNAPNAPGIDGSHADAPVTQEALDKMRRWVADGAKRWRRLIALEAIGLAIAAPLAYLWLVFILDNLVHLPVWGRTAAILIFLGGVAWLGRRLLRDWKRTQLSDDQVALAIERHTPGGLQNRLINAIQISRETDNSSSAGASHQAAREALLRENYHHLSKLRLQQAAEVRPAVIRIAVAAAMVLFGIGFYAFNRDQFTNAAARIFMPFASVDPLYDTKLVIEPGSVRVASGDDVVVRVRIEGRIPSDLVVLKDAGEERSSVSVPVQGNARVVTYTIPRVTRSLAYAVRGGDYTSPYYDIDVPVTTDLRTLHAKMEYPAYTKLPSRETEAVGGDLDALLGTKATLRFTFNQPVDEAVMVVERVVASPSVPPTTQPTTAAATAPGLNGAFDRVKLAKGDGNVFTSELTFKDVVGYRLETRIGSKPVETSRPYVLRVTADLEPTLDLTGLEEHREATMDAILPLSVAARDDFGLHTVALFYRATRPAGQPAAAKVAPTDKPAPPPATTAPAGSESQRSPWESVQTWAVPNDAATFSAEHSLSVAALDVVEGESIEVVLRAQDTNPDRAGAWTDGPSFKFLVGGKDATLQLTYEQIIRSEAELHALIDAQTAAMRTAEEWTRKLEPASNLRWDDKANLDALAKAMAQQAAAQAAIRQRASDTARAMVEQAGNLRISVGMLADTEFIRAIRILEQVPTRDTVQSKRSALADARLTQERTVRSLNEITDAYAKFRRDWELANMTSFTKMLADRETAMAVNSRALAALPAGATGDRQRQAGARRQQKVTELTTLAHRAFTQLGAESKEAVGAILADAFTRAGKSLGDSGLIGSLSLAQQHASAGKWSDTATEQEAAAKVLVAVYLDLRKAQVEAAQLAMADLKQLKESNLDAQKDIEKLRSGTAENLLDIDPEHVKLEEIVEMHDAANRERKKNEAKIANGGSDYMFEESMKGMLEQPDSGTRQEFANLKLAKKPGGAMDFPNSSNREGNKVTPHVQDEFKDLVGDLLEETEELKKDYESFNINANFNINESGEVSKQGGDLNSTAAAAATGNQKPPPKDFGGVSRTGRQGGMAHGLVADKESVNRRGMDKAMAGQEKIADQEGEMKETKSDDPQVDLSTGSGGKVIDAKDNMFSTKDEGEFDPDLVNKMRPPQPTEKVVERKGKPIDPRIADAMRDLNSKQEQVLDRVKAIRKELRNLYLPTDDLEEMASLLAANLEKLKDQPSAEVFRAQLETLDKLKSTVVVFNRASSAFQPSVPREQAVKGSILDEPAWQTIPGYEDAVSRYYQKLAGQRNAAP